MPTYNYECDNCRLKFSVFQNINDKSYTDCKECNTKDSVRRIITGGTGMIFKGDGFYLTDYTDYGKKENKKTNKKEKNKKKEINNEKNKSSN